MDSSEINKKIQEPEFFSLFENYIKESLDLLSKFPTKSKDIVRVDTNHEMWFLILRNLGRNQKLNSFFEIKKWLQEHDWFKKHFNHHVGFGTISHPLSIDDVLRRRVHNHYLESGLIPNKKKIEEMYLELEEFLVSKNISYRINILLSGFKCDRNITIQDGLEIHSLSEEEKYEYNKELEYYEPHVDSVIVYGVLFPKLFKDQHEDSKENYQHQRKPENTSWSLIEALRIFKSGRFGATKIIEHSPFIHHFTKESEGYGIRHREFRFLDGEEYVLHNNEIESFLKFWKKFLTVKENEKNFSFLYRPIRRFMDIYERRDLDDVVIDLRISLEILFTVKKTSTDDLLKRISKFLGLVGAMNMEESKDILKLARELRNDIVHGGDRIDYHRKNGAKINHWEIADEFEELTRQCLRKTIEVLTEKKFSKKQFIEYIDGH